MVWRAKIAIILTIALAFGDGAVLAGGSVPTDEILKLTQKAPRLNSEIQKQLSVQSKTTADLICTSARVGRSVDKQLAGARVGPYNCMVGDKEIDITVHKSPAAAKASKKGQSDAQNSITWQWKQ